MAGDFLHGACICSEIRFQGGVDGCVVEWDDAAVVGGIAEGKGHGDFGAHAVAYEDGLFEILGV